MHVPLPDDEEIEHVVVVDKEFLQNFDSKWMMRLVISMMEVAQSHWQ